MRGMKAAELATAADVARSYVFGGKPRWVGERRVCALIARGTRRPPASVCTETHGAPQAKGWSSSRKCSAAA